MTPQQAAERLAQIEAELDSIVRACPTSIVMFHWGIEEENEMVEIKSMMYGNDGVLFDICRDAVGNIIKRNLEPNNDTKH